MTGTDRSAGWNVGLMIAVLLAASALVPAAQAANPLDDDAGSGGDAGDTHANALPIEPGTYEGRLTPPADQVDRYAVEAERGQVLELDVDADAIRVRVLDPDGRAYRFFLGDDPVYPDMILHKTGTWQVAFKTPLVWLASSPYRFTLDLRDPAGGGVAGGDAEAGAVEARFDEPADVRFQDWMSPPVNATGPYVAHNVITFDGYVDADTDDPRPVQASFSIHRTRNLGGGEVQVRRTGADPGLHLDEGAEGVEMSAGNGRLPGFVGTIRLRGYATTDDSGFALGLWSDRPGEIAAGGSEKTVHWTGGDLPTADKAVTPAGTVVAPWRGTVEMDRSFVGVFDPGGEGWAVSPDGERRDPDWGRVQFDGPEPGTWTLRQNETIVAGGDRTWLSGAFVPTFGIADGVSTPSFLYLSWVDPVVFPEREPDPPDPDDLLEDLEDLIPDEPGCPPIC